MPGRAASLSSLLRFDAPLADLEAGIADLPWDADPAAALTRTHIAGVVRRYLAGLLAAEEVERWANLIECRADIDFEPRHEAAVADAIFDLANPDLQGSLTEIAADVLSLVED